ncbi:MAG: family 20 glycosylhydrolase [Candidatus Delongbacteria bacterium]
MDAASFWPPSLPPPRALEVRPGAALHPGQAFHLHFTPSEAAQELDPEARARLLAHARRRALTPSDARERIPLDLSLRPDLEPEGFELELRAEASTLAAGGEAGLHAGLETLARLRTCDTALPALRVADSPLQAWRGVMLDCARHAWPAPRLHALLEEVAAGRGNRLHLHQTDDQGWSLPLPGRPELAALSPQLSVDELRALVAHGRELGVEILPEVDLPGHCGALLEARPDLACPGRGGPRPRAWGCHEALLCLGNPALPEFMGELLDELAALFPFGVVHLGGDEVPARAWAGCPRCREQARRAGLPGVEALPGWWLRQLEPLLRERGLRGAFWDEALDGPPPPGSLLFAWRGAAAVERCLAAGFATVACPQHPCYLDHYPGSGSEQPRAIGGWNSWQDLRAFDPAGGASAAGLLGAQGNLWSEYVADEDLLMERLQPRLAALLETLWAGPRGAADFAGRLPALLRDQQARGWRPRLDPPHVSGAPLALSGESLDLRITRCLPETELEARWDDGDWEPLAEGTLRMAPMAGRRRLALRQRLGVLGSRPLELELNWVEPWPARIPAASESIVTARWLLAAEPDWRLVAPDSQAEFTLETLDWPRAAVEERWAEPLSPPPPPAEPWVSGPATPTLPPLAPWGPVRGLQRRTTITVPHSGIWRFRLESYSLARLWLDGHLLLDHDGFQPAAWLEGWAPLAAGAHELRLDWLDLRGGSCRLESGAAPPLPA